VGGTAGAAGAAATAVSDLLDLARAFSDFEGPATVGAFLAWVAAAGADRPGAQDAVTVCSFHRAKGLEWPAVWICGLEAGLVPIGGAASEEEERRLLYVAMTRAGRHLRLSWARTRHFRAASVPRQPSPWLRLVDPSTAGSGPPAVAPLVVDVAGWRARVEAQRARLASSPGGGRQRGRPSPRLALPDPDDDVVSALRAWRAGVARASGVPAHVVLHDRTLAALASLRPVDLDGLLAVPGVGPVKASRFGPALLEVLAGTERPAVGS
jgi:DNA helicase-2/ATP-dependent DNA helicase PcrA